MVPVIVFPLDAATGFVCGTVYYLLARYGRVFGDYERSDGCRLINFLHSYRIIHLTSANQQEINAFGAADTYERMRRVSYQIMTTFLTLGIPYYGLTRGFALSRDLISPSQS